MPCDLGLQPGLCIGPLLIRFYGMINVLGILVGGFVATREARWRGENSDRIWDALIWIAIAGIIGARLYHVFSTPAGCTESAPMCGWPWYSQHPLDALLIWNGGLGIFGALLAGGLVVLIYARRHRLPLARYLDNRRACALDRAGDWPLEQLRQSRTVWPAYESAVGHPDRRSPPLWRVHRSRAISG